MTLMCRHLQNKPLNGILVGCSLQPLIMQCTVAGAWLRAVQETMISAVILAHMTWKRTLLFLLLTECQSLL